MAKKYVSPVTGTEYTEEEYEAYHNPPELSEDMLLKNISIKHNGSKEDIQ